MTNGFNSHFVVTNRKGEAVTTEEEETFDEIVIPQESQIMPAFIFHISSDTTTSEAKRWLSPSDSVVFVQTYIKLQSLFEL